MSDYYNEIDPYAAQWIRNLIAAGHLPDGYVDERSILDVSPADLAGFVQCHFFAGIGVWAYALQKSRWPREKRVWTGSCPCQPFSVAGVGSGFDDERHLWPYWHFLIEQCRPPVVFGEQVEAAIRHGWLDLVQADMEGIGYAFAAAGIPAAGVGAPHIRQRLWFVADADYERRHGQHALLRPEATGRHAGGILEATGRGEPGKLAHPNCEQHYRGGNIGAQGGNEHPIGGAACRLDNPDDEGLEGLGRGHQTTGGRFGEVRPIAEAGEFGGLVDDQLQQRPHGEPGVGFKNDTGGRKQSTATITGLCGDSLPGPTNGHWRDADWLFCLDGKWRPVESGTFPLANGAPARVGRLRAYGNAIAPQVAQAMIEAYLSVRP